MGAGRAGGAGAAGAACAGPGPGDGAAAIDAGTLDVGDADGGADGAGRPTFGWPLPKRNRAPPIASTPIAAVAATRAGVVILILHGTRRPRSCDVVSIRVRAASTARSGARV